MGGDTGVDELVAGGNKTFQSGVQHVDGLEDDGSVLGICLLPLGLLCVNLSGGGVDFPLQVCELLLRLAEQGVARQLGREVYES